MNLLNLLLIQLFVLLLGNKVGAAKVRLRKIESLKNQLLRAGLWKQHIESKRLLRQSYARLQSKNVIPQTVKDYDNVQYVGEVLVGSALQKFTILFDTGSSTLWIPGVGCRTKECTKKTKFDPTTSTTFREVAGDFGVIYMDNSTTTGYFGKDTVTLGSGEEFISIESQVFGIATNIDDSTNPQFDGILGLGLSDLDPWGHNPPLINAWYYDLLDKPIFTVWLSGSKDSEYGGEYTYGGLDSDHCRKVIAYEPLVGDSYWQFTIKSFGTEHWKNELNNTTAMSDTGTSTIVVPTAVLDALATELGAEYDGDIDMYLIDCDSYGVPIVIKIGSQKYELPKASYITKLELPGGTTKCYLLLKSFETAANGPLYIFGDVFIRQYCQIYDMENRRIGFARSKTASGSSIANVSYTAVLGSFIALLLLTMRSPISTTT